MGLPKQLLPWGDRTLIEYQIQIRLQTNLEVIVVLGGHSEKILPIIDMLPVVLIVNKDWADGMGGSIASGIRTLNERYPVADGVLISLVDQPLVTTSHLGKMITSFQPGNKQIIASKSASGWNGVPVLFDKFYFEKLLKLNNKEGARKIIHQHPDYVKNIVCDEMLEDIDTPDTYQKLLKKFYFKT